MTPKTLTKGWATVVADHDAGKAAPPGGPVAQLRKAKTALETSIEAEALLHKARETNEVELCGRLGDVIDRADGLAWEAVLEAFDGLGVNTAYLDPDRPAWGKSATEVSELGFDVGLLLAEEAFRKMGRTVSTKTATPVPRRPPLRVSGFASTPRHQLNGVGRVGMGQPQWAVAWKTFAAHGCPLVLGHDLARPVGRVTSARVDADGALWVEAQLDAPTTAAATKVYDDVLAQSWVGLSVGLTDAVTSGDAVLGANLEEITIGGVPRNPDCLAMVSRPF